METSELCRLCGLCCNGVLHKTVTVLPEECQHIKKLGLQVFPHGESFAFNQPCESYINMVCEIYPERPNSCRKYQCNLLKSYLCGEIGENASKKIIQHANCLIKSIFENSESKKSSKVIWDKFREDWEIKNLESVIDRKSNADYIMDITTLAVLIKKYYVLSNML